MCVELGFIHQEGAFTVGHRAHSAVRPYWFCEGTTTRESFKKLSPGTVLFLSFAPITPFLRDVDRITSLWFWFAGFFSVSCQSSPLSFPVFIPQTTPYLIALGAIITASQPKQVLRNCLKSGRATWTEHPGGHLTHDRKPGHQTRGLHIWKRHTGKEVAGRAGRLLSMQATYHSGCIIYPARNSCCHSLQSWPDPGWGRDSSRGLFTPDTHNTPNAPFS